MVLDKNHAFAMELDNEEAQFQVIKDMKKYGLAIMKTKAVTNADRIRAMTDEELAELFEMIPHSGNPPIYTIDGFCIDDGLRTKRQWLNWLKEEAKDD